MLTTGRRDNKQKFYQEWGALNAMWRELMRSDDATGWQFASRETQKLYDESKTEMLGDIGSDRKNLLRRHCGIRGIGKAR